MVFAPTRPAAAPKPRVAPSFPTTFPFAPEVVSPRPAVPAVQAVTALPRPAAPQTTVPPMAPRPDAPIAPPGPASCARCDARLVNIFDEPQCPACGWADYSKIPELSRGTGILSTATRFIIRYAGDSPTLSETLADVRVVRVRNRVAYEVNCPFLECHKTMEQTSLSGRRPEVREQRFRCTDGHRVSLVPGKRGMLGWK